MKFFTASQKKLRQWSHMYAYNEDVRFILTYIPCYIGSEKQQPFADFVQNRCSWKFLKFHRKTLVLETLFSNVKGLQTCNFNKRDSNTGVLLWNLENLQEHLFLQNISSSCSSEEKVPSKKGNILKQGWIKKHLPFQNVLYHFTHLCFFTSVRLSFFCENR